MARLKCPASPARGKTSLTTSITLASNLTNQVRNIADVTTAVARGDLSKKITVDARGEILELKNTVNTMVDQLSSFASEVTRVAKEVGTEGKLGGQADVRGVAGTWKDLTDNVNELAGNLTVQLRDVSKVATAIASGDLNQKITVQAQGEILQIKNVINTMTDQLNAFASEVTRVAREVGTEGKLGGQADVRGVAGTWRDLTDSVNSMAGNLTGQVRNIADVTTAVAKGDLSKKITVAVRGEILELKNTINTMVDQLSAFASEVTRVAREVGTQGQLGGQADVPGVGGTWKDLTDNVNAMASNLTNQVRNIADVTTAVARGDLSKKITVDARGEILELKDTVNTMVDQLSSFAAEVTRVAKEVGTEGQLGGQADVRGVAGTWKDLTDNVNRLAANLTTQVRAIAEVATAVTKGDLSQSINVEAAGEVAALKDNINEMIGNLRDTTEKNTAQDWLKTNLAKFTRLLQGQRDLATVSRTILSELAPLVPMQHGVIYFNESATEEPDLRLLASYAYTEGEQLKTRFRAGEGLVGQAAIEKEPILLTDVPSNYVQISSGLGASAPTNIFVVPVLFEGQVKAVIELASFYRFNETHLNFLGQLTESIGIVLNTITATMRTEELLKQSQSLATELQKTNEELEEKAELLAKQNSEVEQKNREIDQARLSLEDKAAQLALTSRYKSEFLANMSPRAAHPAQFAADSVAPPGAELGRHAHRKTGGVRQDDSRVRLGPARADQRNPRPLEDRVGHDGRRCRAGVAGRRAVVRRSHVPRGRRQQGAEFPRQPRSAHHRLDHHRPEARAAGAQEPDLERDQVHRAGIGHADDRAGDARLDARPCRPRSRHQRGGVHGRGHRHRHRAGQAPGHLRSVPAGRRHDQPQVRRHRPRPFDQP